MGRKKNDGLGRFGGRKKGTPNKANPLKLILHSHSEVYFERNISAENAEGMSEAWKAAHKGEILSQFEIDLCAMKPSERAKAELELLTYHTPKMQAISADMAVKNTTTAFTDRLERLASGEDIPADDEEL